MLRNAGIETSAYGKYLWNLQKTIPAMTFAGYFDSEGNAYSHLDTTKFTPLIEDTSAYNITTCLAATNARQNCLPLRQVQLQATPQTQLTAIKSKSDCYAVAFYYLKSI